MLEIKEVLRLWCGGTARKRIAAQLGLDIKTVRRYVRTAQASGSWPAGDAPLDDERVAAVVAALQHDWGRQRGEARVVCAPQRSMAPNGSRQRVSPRSGSGCSTSIASSVCSNSPRPPHPRPPRASSRSAPAVDLRLRHVRRAFGTMLARDITFDQVNAYVANRLEDAKPATVRYERALLGRMLQLAYHAGKLDRIPALPTVAVGDNVSLHRWWWPRLESNPAFTLCAGTPDRRIIDRRPPAVCLRWSSSTLRPRGVLHAASTGSHVRYRRDAHHAR